MTLGLLSVITNWQLSARPPARLYPNSQTVTVTWNEFVIANLSSAFISNESCQLPSKLVICEILCGYMVEIIQQTIGKHNVRIRSLAHSNKGCNSHKLIMK